jgi:hypothetical protein
MRNSYSAHHDMVDRAEARSRSEKDGGTGSIGQHFLD